jgi:Fic family protein
LTPKDFSEKSWGIVRRQPANYWAFVPHPLPPELDLDWELVTQLTNAERALARLEGIGRILTNPHLLIGPFMRREAVLSSRIEGTQASLSELLLFEAGRTEPPRHSDVREVSNYVTALEYGLVRLKTLPISLRLMGELHQRLMDHVRGGHLTPGEFRRTQNWIGSPGCTLNEATYVPPPVPEMIDALGQLEKFIHAPGHLPELIRLSLIHYQFEAIHPYVDGNGRIGRLLITLLLCERKVLHQPLLYLSAFFEKHRNDYYRLLMGVSQRGEWRNWILFFLRGVEEQSTDALVRTARLLDLQKKYTAILHAARASALPLRMLDELFRHPVTSIPRAARFLGVTPRAAGLIIEKLEEAKILKEVTGQERNRWYVAMGIVDVTETEVVDESADPTHAISLDAG